VYIAFDSKSLGDTIAWMPYVLEFQKKHKCKVIVSTHKNFLFKDVYPELEFVSPGSRVDNIIGMYTIGWFYNADKEPELCNTIPLQKAASNILGLDYQEIKPRIAFTPGENPYGKYIAIATNSTSGCKFWTKDGWQLLINFLHEKGYKVINTSQERNPFEHCEQLEDTSIENTMNVIHHSHLFIGLSSGLSWLAWAMDKKVVMISNFTEADHEFSCIRIHRDDVCHGCWNKPHFRFDPGDWDWCPEHKGTARHFECHREITASQVIFALLDHI
jgi:autotransporter strand-loop-strand O-heptosyltransferase